MKIWQYNKNTSIPNSFEELKCQEIYKSLYVTLCLSNQLRQLNESTNIYEVLSAVSIVIQYLDNVISAKSKFKVILLITSYKKKDEPFYQKERPWLTVTIDAKFVNITFCFTKHK